MYLCIDTITSQSGVSLISANEAFGWLKIDPKKASEDTLLVIDQLLVNNKLSLENLKGIFVIKGPGSFTGLRVGISIANQFAHQLEIPILGVKTDDYFRYQTDESDFFYLQSMNRDEFYGCKFSDLHSEPSIFSVHDLSIQMGDCFKWVGDIRPDHELLLDNYEKIKSLKSADQTWLSFFQNHAFIDHKKYQLVEAFYGKDPSITQSKKLTI